jgi:hypothetical protein
MGKNAYMRFTTLFRKNGFNTKIFGLSTKIFPVFAENFKNFDKMSLYTKNSCYTTKIERFNINLW